VIADIRTYRDLAEFEYDIRNNDVDFRPLDGWWPEALKRAGESRLLSEKGIVAKHARKALSTLQS